MDRADRGSPEKEGLTICGKKGILPVITTAGAEEQLRRSLPGPVAAVVAGTAGDRAGRIGRAAGAAMTAEKAAVFTCVG